MLKNIFNKNMASITRQLQLTAMAFSVMGTATSVDAASIRPAMIAGLMQQPSSQYYHYVYGGQLDVARKDDAAYLRLQYIERPAFKSAGFIDQDFSSSLFFGKSVLKQGGLGIGALIGAGYAWGYLKEAEGSAPKREAYRMPGFGAGIEGKWANKSIDIRASYQTLICQNDRSQFDYYVAWPFSWFLVTVSTPITIGGR
jgi:hypothetical protein